MKSADKIEGQYEKLSWDWLASVVEGNDGLVQICEAELRKLDRELIEE